MVEKINLLVLTHNYPRFKGDFAGVFIHLLCRKLVDFNIQPVILAPHDPGVKEYEEWDGVKIYRFRYADTDENENIAYRGQMHKLVLGSVSGIFQFKNFLDKFRQAAFEVIDKESIDIVSGHWLVPAGLIMKTIKKKTGLPMILSSHGTDIRLIHKYFNAAYRYLKSFCHSLYSWTMVSNYLKDEILSLDPTLKDILKVLPLPHDETIFYKDDLISKDKNLVTSVTRFTEQKRVDYLIKAFALVNEKLPDAKLHIYGEGDLQPEIESLIHKFGLQEKVTIFPAVDQSELRSIYNRSTIVVLNSYLEGFGLTLSEAMMCGTAVIGTDSGGIKDIIKHNETGLLVKIDDSQNLAESIISLLTDDEKRNNIAENGYLIANKKYSSSELASLYADKIKSALG